MPTKTRRLPISVIVALVVASAACQPAPSSAPDPSAIGTASAPPARVATPSPGATVDRVSGWRADLELIVPGMDRIHPNLTHGTTLEALNEAVADLTARVDTSTDDELMVGVASIVAMVSAEGHDGHTGLFVWGTGTYPVDSLPFRLWLFEDEVVIVDALAPYEDLVDTRIDTIEGRPIGEVLAALDPLVPRDNAQTVRLLTPRYLLIPQVLRGLGIVDEGPIAVGLTTAEGVEDVHLIEPVPMAEYNAWAGPYGLHLPADPLARLEAGTSATIVGESMGGNPTFYGDTTEVPLPYSGLSITVTGMLEVGVDPDDPRDTIEVDQLAPLTREAWRDGIDPALERIVVEGLV